VAVNNAESIAQLRDIIAGFFFDGAAHGDTVAAALASPA